MTNSAPSERSDTQKDQTPSEGRWGSIRKWFENNWSQVLLFVGGLALYFLLGLLLWWLLQRYVDPSAIKDPSKEATAKKDLLQALGLIMAGVAGAIGIYFTWRGQRITRKGLEDTQKSTEEQLRLTREGQITERFTRAIDQLGATNDDNSKNLELRLGGIYALERIARESEEDHWSIMEVLTAYVRQNSPRRAFEGQQAEKRLVESFVGEAIAELGVKHEGQQAEEDAAVDIQAIMTVLGRSSRSFEYGEYGESKRLDLTATNLRAAKLSGAKLSGAKLSGANLTKADLWGANLSYANLWGADLTGASLMGDAKLTDVYLTGADLTGAYLTADLTKANLWGANLTGAYLWGADLSEAEHLTQAKLEKTKSGDENTRLPPDLKPPAHWSVRKDKQSGGD